jgi:hypothetical protein
MSRRALKHLCIFVGVLVLAVLVLRIRRDKEMDRRFDEVRLSGLSTGEVQRLVGSPDFIESNLWLYFSGGTPVAALRFRDGRLEAVERTPW